MKQVQRLHDSVWKKRCIFTQSLQARRLGVQQRGQGRIVSLHRAVTFSAILAKGLRYHFSANRMTYCIRGMNLSLSEIKDNIVTARTTQ